MWGEALKWEELELQMVILVQRTNVRRCHGYEEWEIKVGAKMCFFKGQYGLRNNNMKISLLSYKHQTFWSPAAKYNDPGLFTTVLEPSNPLFRS